VEERRNNPIPFLILATGVGYLARSWWVGLLVGIGMTIIPGVVVLALFIQNRHALRARPGLHGPRLPVLRGAPRYPATRDRATNR
jgi:hypothetical protein